MASQSANPGGSGDQDGALRSPVSSFRGVLDRDDSKGVFGSHLILDDCRSRKQAARVPELLQQLSCALLIGGKNTRQEGTTTGRESDVLSMAISLSRLVPDTDRCVSPEDSPRLSGMNPARLRVRKPFTVHKREMMG